MTLKRVLVLATLFGSVLAPARAEDPGYIRVEESEKAAMLQTAVTRFEKDGVTVDLIGAVHIADQAYYEALTERFANYDSLLFEMVGGESLKKQADEVANTHSLTRIYAKIARALGLVGQMEHIDYRAANFVHADLTMPQFLKKQAEKGESIWKLLAETSKSEEATAGAQPKTFGLIVGLLTKRPDIVKLSIIHAMGDAGKQIDGALNDSVIFFDRNIRCMEVLDEQIRDGKRNLGVFYGAAHLPHMQELLEERGFKRTTHEWVTAWNVTKPAKRAEQVSPVGPEGAR